MLVGGVNPLDRHIKHGLNERLAVSKALSIWLFLIFIYIPGFLKTGLAKISTHSTTWQFKTTKLIQRPIKSLYMQARNQDFIWGGANEAKADPTTEMYFLSSDPFI